MGATGRFCIIVLAIFIFNGNACAQVVVIHPEPAAEALPNPFKGYAPYADTFYPDPAIPQGLVYDDVTWKALEPVAAGQIDWNALEDDWVPHTGLGRRIGFRFKCADPWTDDPTDIPDWLVAMGVQVNPYAIDGGTGNLPQWDHPLFLDQHDRIIAELGARYNQDPRIAWVDVGSYGIWGEWHVYENEHLAASRETKQRILDAYIAAFPDTQLVIPFDDDFATFYYPWPVNVAFARGGTIETETAVADPEWDCRIWMPGETVMVAKIPTPPGTGTYDILFSIHDPNTGQPAIRLANDGHLGNHRYRLGQVDVIAGDYAAGDIDHDGDVDAIDLQTLQSAFGAVAGETDYNPAADFDASYRIDAIDLSRWALDLGY